MVSVTLNLETDMVERFPGTYSHDIDVLGDAVKKIVSEKILLTNVPVGQMSRWDKCLGGTNVSVGQMSR